jgi:quinol-cytochrome oxidoreductase complex cytochrome b subunit
MQSPWQRQFEGAYKRPRSALFMAMLTLACCILTVAMFGFIRWVEGL